MSKENPIGTRYGIKRGPEAKRLIARQFGIKLKSVRRGRGTASGWLDVIPYEKDYERVKGLRNEIEQRLQEEQLCGTYYSDTGINDSYVPCVNFFKEDGCECL